MAHTPDDPAVAQVWVTKGLDELDFEFYIPQGPKGDAGGFTAGTVVTGDKYLNDYLTPGLYQVTAPATLGEALAQNFPINIAGSMAVHASNSATIQHYITNTQSMYIRRKFGSTWSSWRGYHATRIDQTAGRVFYQWDEINGRDQLVWGDTGQRSIQSLIPSVTAGTVIIRRVGSTVEMIFNDLVLNEASTSSLNIAGLLPYGFRPNIWGNFMTLGSSSIGSTSRAVRTKNTGDVAIYGFVQNEVIRGSFSWFTLDPWPTTLPGTASGSIPVT